MVSKVAIVTGSNKGIGFEIARQLGDAGYKIIVACRDELRGTQAIQNLSNLSPNGKFEFEKLDISSSTSIQSFSQRIATNYSSIDVLVNNAAIAFKNSDNNPLSQQAVETLNINYTGTKDLTLALIPLLLKASHPRIVFVASMTGHLDICKDNETRATFSKAETGELTLDELNSLVESFVSDISTANSFIPKWPASCYGFSKLAVIALTKILARKYPSILINACCPGYCDTDMSSHMGPRPPSEGAQTPVHLALLDESKTNTGEFWKDLSPAQW